MNLNRKTGLLVGAIALSLSAVGIFTFANSGSRNETPGMTKSIGSRDANFVMNSSEVMFLQGMIPHHEQAVIMSEFALSNSTNPKIIALAKQIKAAQSPEISQMKSWLDQVDAGYTMDHDMGMNGMLSDADLTELEAARGKTFDALFLKGMIAHHEGAIAMASTIVNSSNLEIKTLHDNIVKSQSAEISEMKVLLKSL